MTLPTPEPGRPPPRRPVPDTGPGRPNTSDASAHPQVDLPTETDRVHSRGPLIPPLPARRRAPNDSVNRGLWRAAAALTMVAAFGLYVYGTVRPVAEDRNAAWGLVLFPLACAAAAVMVKGAASRETRFDLLGIALTGFALRGVGAFLRFNAAVDALVYHEVGSSLADDFRSLNFFVDTGREIPGTGTIRYVSGLTHAFLVDDMFATFVFFMFLAFTGTFLLYKAFIRAVPDGDHRRYALLVFLWPSLLFWPSSIGKEAWMLFGLGIAANGVSLALGSAWARGMLTLAAGLVVLSLVRPHIALMVIIAFGVALLIRPGRTSTFRFFGRVLSIGLLLVGGAIVAGKTADLLKVDNTGAEGLNSALEETAAKTSQGGAAFKPPIVRTPADYPLAFATVWFRPFLWEARGGDGESASTQMITAAEGVLLLGLLAMSWRRLITLPRALLRLPYVTFAVTFVVVFAYAFAVIGNFGILARQRTQGIMLFFVVLCIPVVPRASPRIAKRDAANAGRERRAGHLPSRVEPPDDQTAPERPSPPAVLGPSAPGVRTRAGTPSERTP